MPQVSRVPVEKSTKKKLADIFVDTFSETTHRTDMDLIIKRLLTRTEQMMISKRLFISVLLLSGYSYKEVKDLVKVSSATVAKINNLLGDDLEFRRIIVKLRNKYFPATKTAKDSVFGKIETFVSAKRDMKSRAKIYSGDL